MILAAPADLFICPASLVKDPLFFRVRGNNLA
jgi:hypothetical protein